MPRETPPKKGRKPKCTDLTASARVDELLRLRLDGAEMWDVREYVREQEKTDGSNWKLEEGETPLSDSQIRRYLQRVDEQIEESCRAHRVDLMRKHLAKRRNLYAKAVLAGDYRTALQCVRDEAEMIGLYEKGKILRECSEVLSPDEMELLEALLSKATDGTGSTTTRSANPPESGTQGPGDDGPGNQPASASRGALEPPVPAPLLPPAAEPVPPVA